MRRSKTQRNNMQIKVFIASSEELKEERICLGALLNKLCPLYEAEGHSLKLLVWEDFDSAYNGMRKQDEYNEWIRESDLFFGVFWNRTGNFTLEELDVAEQSHLQHGHPDICILFKDDVKDQETVSRINQFINQKVRPGGFDNGKFRTDDDIKYIFTRKLLERFPLEQVSFRQEGDEIRLGRFKIARVSRLTCEQ